MLNYFKCDEYVKDYLNIDLDKLKNKGIKIVFCDIDNTLVPYYETYATLEATTFINNLKEAGFIVVLASNNTKKRVATFAKKLDVEYSYSTKKPFVFAFKKFLKKYDLKNNQACLIGDQLFTDIVAAKRLKAYCILVKPKVERDLLITKCNRFLENIIFKLLEKNNHLKKGEYDDDK